METINYQSFWDNVYNSKAENELSWFQSYPKISVEFIESLRLTPDAAIIDIGGGDSRFAEALLDKGYQNIFVLDISAMVIERAKQRLGEKASRINWIVSDITEFQPSLQFDCWHDRAAFHFLTAVNKIHKYISIAQSAIKKGGHLILGTFSEDGLQKCSGLEIKQYSEASLSARFETAFERENCIKEDHQTPFNTMQNFLFCRFRKK